MIKHTHTESTEINFAKLEERLLQINDPDALTNFTFTNHGLLFRDVPSLIVATGGSKAAAYYLKMFFESRGTIAEVIEPRDFFYKQNTNIFQNLIAISNSGKTNGILDILRSTCKPFHGAKFLITGDYIEQSEDYYLCGSSELPIFFTLYWGNRKYDDREKSFVSIIPTLAPMLMVLELALLIEQRQYEISKEDLVKINDKLKDLFARSKEKVDKLDFNFKNTNLIQVMSGYDTQCSSCILESNMVETGTSSIVIHDKGSYCHGRSNLLFQNPKSPMVYLAHQMKGLDDELLKTLTKRYPNIFLFDTLDENSNLFWKEYYLALQMYFLSKKIAEDKNIDLTCPEYDPHLVRKLYNYRGEM